MTKLGKKLENPYSVANMKKAFDNLQKHKGRAKTMGGISEVTTTHLYIKFKPKTEEELDILKSDTTLILYDYPLDYRIEEGGSYYHDPEVPADQPTYQYCAVGVDKQLPSGVEYEVLEELFIPDEDKIEDDEEENAVRAKKASTTFAYNLVDEALRITGNLEEDEKNLAVRARRSKWRPAGRVRVWDNSNIDVVIINKVFDHWVTYDCTPYGGYNPMTGRTVPPQTCRRAVYRNDTTIIRNNYVPVEGVEVRARRWFTTHKGYTNSQGNYSCNGRFRRPANYSIVWERRNFEIRRKDREWWKVWKGVRKAKNDGPKMRGDWNLNLRNGEQQYYATIFRAAYHYYYKDIRGLRRPPQLSRYQAKLKINANLGDFGGDLGLYNPNYWYTFGSKSPILITSYGNDSDEIYATTIHELAHASHWNLLRKKTLRGIERRVIESWARGVEWELTRMVYPEYEGGDVILPNYTQVVVDMIDAISDDGTNEGASHPDDQVTGYTIRQIEDALLRQKTWNAWRDNIINKYENETEDNLEALFNHWN